MVKQTFDKLRTELPPEIADELLSEERIKELSDEVLNGSKYKPGDGRAFYKALKDRTGFTSLEFDCCEDTCVSYSRYPDEPKCPRCSKPRWRPGTKEPYKTHVYFPLRHRLLLWFTSTFMSKLIKAYRRKATMLSMVRKTRRDRAGRTTTTRTLTDVWSGKLYTALREKGFLGGENDLAFCCGFDGTKAFKTRKNRYVWPIILTCLNLPPEIRFKRKNVIVAGIIPGPNTPKDLDSFLKPLVDEFELLTNVGVPNVWDAAPDTKAKQRFTLRAYLVLITTDQAARIKILHLMGHTSISYCPYCHIKGLHFGSGNYCPHRPPDNIRDSVFENIEEKIADGRPYYNWERDYTFENSVLREDVQFRQIAAYIETNRAEDPIYAERTGISGQSIFARLPTLFFPASFPPCTMHLFYENVVQTMFEHLAGRYFVKRPDPKSTKTNDGDTLPTPKKPPKDAPKFARREGKDAPFKKILGDSYTLDPMSWRQIGKDTAASNSTYPDQLGEEMTNLETTFRKMKAANWQRFLFHQSPVYFREYLPKEHYDEWMNMVDAMRLATRKELDESEVSEVCERPSE